MPTLLILDYWEKLAGASLALAAVIRLCQRTGLSLVAPSVGSSIFLPGPATGSFPLSAYYDVSALRKALKPQLLLDHAAWQRVLAVAVHTCLLVVVYDDFPASCTQPMASRAADDHACPGACLALGGVRRLMASVAPWASWASGGSDRRGFHGGSSSNASSLRANCVLGAELRMAIHSGTSGRAAAVLRSHDAVALLNFRRHDQSRPMLPQAEAAALRAAAVQPSRAVRSAARRFLAVRRMPPHAYVAVQMRSNHLAQAAFAAAHAASSRSAASSSPPNSRHGGRLGVDATSSSCTQRVLSCARKLSRTARRLGPPTATVVASDLATLHQPNQDGATHRKKAHVRACLMPALPALHGWYQSTGHGLNCSGRGPAAGDSARRTSSRRGGSSSSRGGSGGRRGGGGNRRLSERVQPSGGMADGGMEVSAAERACDAGWLGLVDLVLASEATAFVAVDAGVWRSAFLEWILQLRHARSGVDADSAATTQVIKCS